MIEVREIRHGHLFCGLGGGAKGFNRGHARVGPMEAKFRCIGGIDVDAAAIRDFDKLAGAKGTLLDLFDRAQYRAFHGKDAPAGWREAVPDDIRRAFGNEHPHILFLGARAVLEGGAGVMHIISLGAGVQSSTMALMATAGEITPMPDCAIFADTQGEPRAVYEWLDWLEGQLPFPVHRVTQGNLADLIGIKPNGKFDYMPLPGWVKGSDGRASLLNRSCTRDYKIIPIRRKVRELIGLTGKRSPKEPVVTQWIGISIDEIQRAKAEREPWMKHRWPLIELGRARRHCLDWMKQRGFPVPPRSACGFCPFRSDAEWLSLKNDPADFELAVSVDERIRNLRAGQMSAPAVFLHRSLKPLREVDFVAPSKAEPDLFDETGFAVECEGMCGL